VQPLRAFGSNILWYPSAAAGAVGDPTAPTPSSLFKGVQWFYVSQTVNNCTSVIDSIKVTINPKPNVKAVSPFKVCPRDTVLLTASTDSANVTKFEWSPSLYLPQTVGASVTAHPETDVKYMVVATNIFGCTDSEYVNITVHPNAVIYVGDSVTIFPGESYQINPQTNGTSFVWSPTAGLDNPNISNPIARPDANTRYVVKTISEQGCMATDTLNIYVSTESLLTLPNAFTPGSGANNTFKVIKRGLAVLNHFRIYNRWGEVVFETNDIDAGWDGTYKGVPQPFGVYVYEVSAVTNTGKQFIKTGNVTLIR
jgi:gliding motility-associated-like protein